MRSEKESMNKELIAHTIATVNFQRGGEFFTEKEANGTPVVAADAESITFSVGYFSRGIVFFTGRNICDTLGGGCYCCRREVARCFVSVSSSRPMPWLQA